MTNIIVFHTAWMAKYDGDRASFSAGGFKYAVENGYGHEMFNFREIDGAYYGYVPPTGNLHLEKHFDVARDAEKLDGLTVVWTAPHPEQRGRAVVGVWKNATVYREDQEPKRQIARHRKVGPGDFAGYRCTAKAQDCVLLSPGSRPIFVRPSQPRTGGSWPGQQKVFYPKAGSSSLKRLETILNEIAATNASARKASGRKAKSNLSNWQADVELRKQIEVAAIKAVGSKLEGVGYEIKSVEKDNVGYDLVATRYDEVLHVEVKGRSGHDICADLSSNEFDCLKQYVRERKPGAHYRIAIVTQALVNPVINEFALVSGQKSQWCTLDGGWRLEFKDRTAARITAVSMT
jgi:Domain of unknown function (DUF3883)